MGEYLAPVENELASVTLADLNTDINRVLDLASDAGANAAIHNRRINAKLINTLYNLARNNIQDQEAAIISVNMIVSEYAKGWLRKKEEKEKETESSGKIRLMGLSEFKELEGAYPHKRNLYRSMNPVQYCKAESYGDCLFGTMKIPPTRI